MRVYQIVSDSAGLRYVGATTQSLEERFLRHKINKIRHERGLYHRVTSFDVLAHPDARVELLEVCGSKEQLQQRERYHIESLVCVNKQIPGRSHREWNEGVKRCHICNKLISRRNMARHIKNIHTDPPSDDSLSSMGSSLSGQDGE